MWCRSPLADPTCNIIRCKHSVPAQQLLPPSDGHYKIPSRAPQLLSPPAGALNFQLGRVHRQGPQRQQVVLGPRTPRLLAAAIAQEASSTSSDEGEATFQLENFLGWLVSNGVQGVGQADSKLALYEGEDGDRGVLSTQDIQPGEVLLRVPLRLALTDHPEDEESNSLLYEGAPWSVRLSAKLLRQKALGAQSPWYPYLQVLPQMVPAPLETFSWEDMQAIQYQPAQTALFEYDWLVRDAFDSCNSDALGGATDDDFKWAMSVVHSRTFGSAAQQGGVGVRMLVPLIDMFNHAGDMASGLLDGESQAFDNVRWDLVPPALSQTGGWEMAVSATRNVEAGSPLLLSYGERANDDFFLHYGFVPPGNPHDEVVLFANLEEALEWHYREFNAQMDVSQAEPLYARALALAQDEQQQDALQLQQAGKPAAADGQAAAPMTTDTEAAKLALAEAKKLKVLSGGRLSGPLMTAFTHVCHGDAAAASAAVARRCQQLLESMPPSLTQDLQTLQADAHDRQDEYMADYYSRLLAHYLQQKVEQLPAASQQGHTDTAQALSTPRHVPQDSSWNQQQEPSCSASTPDPNLDTQQGVASQAWGVVDSSSTHSHTHGSSSPNKQLSHSQRLLTSFLLYKKMILVDLISQHANTMKQKQTDLASATQSQQAPARKGLASRFKQGAKIP